MRWDVELTRLCAQVEEAHSLNAVSAASVRALDRLVAAPGTERDHFLTAWSMAQYPEFLKDELRQLLVQQ